MSLIIFFTFICNCDHRKTDLIMPLLLFSTGTFLSTLLACEKLKLSSIDSTGWQKSSRWLSVSKDSCKNPVFRFQLKTLVLWIQEAWHYDSVGTNLSSFSSLADQWVGDGPPADNPVRGFDGVFCALENNWENLYHDCLTTTEPHLEILFLWRLTVIDKFLYEHELSLEPFWLQ